MPLALHSHSAAGHTWVELSLSGSACGIAIVNSLVDEGIVVVVGWIWPKLGEGEVGRCASASGCLNRVERLSMRPGGQDGW